MVRRSPDPLERTLGSPSMSSRALKSALVFAILVAAIIGATQLDRAPDLSHVDVAFLSGSEQGNYHAIVERIGAEARRRDGRVRNVPSAGSVENLARLASAKSGCAIQYALVQDGMPWPTSHTFQLIGRLPVAEAFVVLGRDGDRISRIADLRGKRVGIGPVGSGTEHVARQVMAQLEGLDVAVSTQPIAEQLAMLERGDLDFGVMVIDRDARQLADAVRRHGLQIVDLVGAEAIAHRLPSGKAGVIKAGHYDPVRMLPPTDKRVIDIDTLVIGNGCARESVTQGMLTALVAVFPDFVRANRERPNLSGLAYASAASSFIENDGPDEVGEHVPWIIDLMPMSRWLQLIFAFSTLFAAQALWHRFRLWRLDARRVALETRLAALFSPGATVSDIASMPPDDAHRGEGARASLATLIADLEALAKRCRAQSLSMLVPMGQEMGYRYQEQLIGDLLHALRAYRARL
jgi:TRAP-type uncharacterized transport system substrate-binding protein